MYRMQPDQVSGIPIEILHLFGGIQLWKIGGGKGIPYIQQFSRIGIDLFVRTEQVRMILHEPEGWRIPVPAEIIADRILVYFFGMLDIAVLQG